MDYIKRTPLVLLSIYFIKILVWSPTLVDGLALAILAGLSAYYETVHQSRKIQTLAQRTSDLEAQLAELKKENQEVKSYVTSMKLGQQMRFSPGVR